MWTPHWSLPLRRDRMTTPTIEGDDMGDDIEIERGEHDELPAGYERDAELEAEIEKIIDDEPEVAGDAGTVRVRIGTNVNTYKRGDELTVPADHPFWGGLIKQGIAEVID